MKVHSNNWDVENKIAKGGSHEKKLGHKTTRTTQRYAKVRNNKISRTLERVKGIVFTDDGQLKSCQVS
jgi:hypothetical protein